MKVLVLGAGVVGVSTAWYLAKAGHEVSVIDRQAASGLETSFANGGQISPCHAEPWANPSTPAHILKWLGHPDAPLVFRWWRWDPALWAWGLRFLANCTAGQARINTDRTLRVALYARQCLQDLRSETAIEYDQKTLGILHIYRDNKEFSHARHAASQMQRLGLQRLIKTPAEALALEPALAHVHPQLAGAIYTPGDESGDAFLFTQRLAALCADKGVTFHYNTTILGLELDGGRLSGVTTDKGRFRPDAVVLAMASWSPRLTSQLNMRLPIYPAKGYSATLPVSNQADAPNISITDDEHKVVYTRLGERLRCAGTAEMAGWNNDMTPLRAQAIVTQARQLFPTAGNYDHAELWCGLRAVTPDSVPILGQSRVPNLYLNTGHGTLGWTMACGTGRILADIISGRPADIDLSGLGPDRFFASQYF